MPTELGRPSRHRFGLECTPTSATIFRQPIINSRAVDAQRLRYNFRALAILHASDRARSHFFERLVIQLARVSVKLISSYLIANVFKRLTHLRSRPARKRWQGLFSLDQEIADLVTIELSRPIDHGQGTRIAGSAHNLCEL